MTPMAEPATLAAAPIATPSALGANVPRPIPASTVLGYSIVVALLLSTQYLAQPFVWTHWPWDEVLCGWLEILRDRIVVASATWLAPVPPDPHCRSAAACAADRDTQNSSAYRG